MSQQTKNPELTGYTPPADPEAEQATLGAVLVRPSVLNHLRDRVLEAVKVAVAGGEKRDFSRERQLELELNRAKQLIGDQAMVIEILKKSG